ncbi:MAG: hypothetical protein WAL83_04740 [Arenicellales bacterium]
MPGSASDSDVSDTALGDWYVNRIVIDRQPLLLLMSSTSLLPVLIRARDVKTLPDRIGDIVASRLKRMGIGEQVIVSEVGAMDVVLVGRTRDRSVTGQMVDFAKVISHYLPVDGWDDSALRLVEDRLGEIPCRCGRPGVEVVLPTRDATRLLAERWPGTRRVH